jgi:site-specific recombinase XerD
MSAVTVAVIPSDNADPLGALVLGWLATKRSVHTRRAYARDIAEWLGWLADAGRDPLAATETDAANWARRLDADGFAPQTKARRLSAVSSWHSWLKRQHRIGLNPLAELARPKLNRDTSTTPGLTKAQALAVLAAADASRGPQALRTAALMSVLVHTGARVSEATGADVEDLGTDRGHRVLWVTRKGEDRQALVLPPPAGARVDAYLASRGDMTTLPALPGRPGLRPKRPLFATEAGRRMLPADVWRLVRRLGKAAGLPADLVARIGPHAMRHSFATLYLDSGGSLRDLQDAMGHADPRTTRRYDRARNSLDRSPGYALAAYLADGQDA